MSKQREKRSSWSRSHDTFNTYQKKKKSVGYVVNVFYLSEYTKGLNACHLQNVSLLFITENKKVQSKNQ